MSYKPFSRSARALIAGLVLALSGATGRAAEPVPLSAFMALERPTPTEIIPYGSGTVQAVDLFLPQGSGPHPVAILIHGGCWSARTDDRRQLRDLGAELAREGVAVWSIGYRRANEEGGGYPGMYEDVAQAIDLLRAEGPRRGLDLSRTLVAGHSAGGHLALWAASRDRLPAASPLRRADPLIPRFVISLAGIGDLKAFAPFIPIFCGPGVEERLSPAGSRADVSPTEMAPPKVPVLMVSGVLDRLVPPYVAHDYAQVFARGGWPRPERVEVSGAGHFDLVTPGTPARTEVKARIVRTLGRHP